MKQNVVCLENLRTIGNAVATFIADVRDTHSFVVQLERERGSSSIFPRRRGEREGSHGVLQPAGLQSVLLGGFGRIVQTSGKLRIENPVPGWRRRPGTAAS